MIINSREEEDYDSVKSAAQWDFLARRKAYAVGVMAIVWAGGRLPNAMIREANHIEHQMVKDGTWQSA